MTCSVDNENYKKGKWYFNKKLISTENAKYLIKTDGKIQQLSIKNVTPDDTGSYAFVTGSNSLTEASLKVTPIHVITALENVVGAETAAVELNLTLSHDNVRGCWYRNGQPLLVRKLLFF